MKKRAKSERAEHEMPKESAEFVRGYLMALRFAIIQVEHAAPTGSFNDLREALVESHNEEAEYWGIRRVQ